MKMNVKQEAPLALLSLVFAVGLTYASIALPRFVNEMIHGLAEFPGADPRHAPDVLETFVSSYHLQIIGYGALGLLLVLVVVGLVAEKRGLATAGAVGFFLPVFGHFCRSMFFLAGLGLLRTMWMPITDLSVDLLRLGDIVYLPYMMIVWLLALVGVDVRGGFGYVVMVVGIMIFVLGVLAWLMTRYRRRETADFWVYRFSRHPQYLGWIVWSYGLMIYFMRNNEGTLFKLSWGFPDSLPFLISAIVIIAVALLEEINMRRTQGEDYEAYSRQTPFMLPLPSLVNRMVAVPLRLVLRKDRPETGREVAVVVAVYAAILILLSVPFVLFHWPPRSGWWGYPYNVFPFG